MLITSYKFLFQILFFPLGLNYTLFIEALLKDFSGETDLFLDSEIKPIDDLLTLDHFRYSSSNQPLIILLRKVTFLKYLVVG